MNEDYFLELLADNYTVLLTFVAVILLFLNFRALRKESRPVELVHKTSKNSFDFIRKEMKVLGKQGLVFASGGSVKVRMFRKQGDYKVVFPESVYEKIFIRQRLKSKFLAAIFSTIPCNEDAYTTKNSHYIVVDKFVLSDPKTMVVEEAHTEEHVGRDKVKRAIIFTMISFHKWLICGLFFIMFINFFIKVFGLNPQSASWFNLLCEFYFMLMGFALFLWFLVILKVAFDKLKNVF